MKLSEALLLYTKKGYRDELEQKLSFYKGLDNLERAVTLAVSGQIPIHGHSDRTRLDNHQFRIRLEARDAILNVVPDIKRDLLGAGDFDSIFKVIERYKARVKWLGDLWSYDTALRITAFYGQRPQVVAMQSGVVDGAKKLMGVQRLRGRFLSADQFPALIGQTLKPHEIENFLCVGNKQGWFDNIIID